MSREPCPVADPLVDCESYNPSATHPPEACREGDGHAGDQRLRNGWAPRRTSLAHCAPTSNESMHMASQNQEEERSEPEPEPTPEADAEARTLTTMICINCGAEQFFTSNVPDTLTCERCKGTVFRAFSTPLTRDEAALSALEEQARSVSYGDPSPGTTPDELRDLGR